MAGGAEDAELNGGPGRRISACGYGAQDNDDQACDRLLADVCHVNLPEILDLYTTSSPARQKTNRLSAE